MNGLPEITKPSRPQSAFYLLFIAGLERVTKALMDGKAFDQRALDDMQLLRRRCDAFSRALDARMEVVDEDTAKGI